MSETASPGAPPPHGQHGPPAPPGPVAPWPPGAPMLVRRPSRWPSLVAVVIALIALGVGVAGWFRPMSKTDHPSTPPAPTYTEQQIADAKANVCSAYKLSKDEVTLNTHRPNFDGDPVGSVASAALKRFSVYAAGDYLLDRLTAEPATPPDLATTVRSLANYMRNFGIPPLTTSQIQLSTRSAMT